MISAVGAGRLRKSGRSKRRSMQLLVFLLRPQRPAEFLRFIEPPSGASTSAPPTMAGESPPWLWIAARHRVHSIAWPDQPGLRTGPSWWNSRPAATAGPLTLREPPCLTMLLAAHTKALVPRLGSTERWTCPSSGESFDRPGWCEMLARPTVGPPVPGGAVSPPRQMLVPHTHHSGWLSALLAVREASSSCS